MIQLIDVKKVFDEKVLFENFNLQIDDGEFVIISGDSGSGKTTLLNMIGALEKVDGGKIIVDNIDVSNKKNHLNLFRYKYGFLFQNFALIDNKTVFENLNIFKNDSVSGTTIEEALNSVNLSDKRNCPVYKLSGGEQQRVALARLLIKQCDIVLADEPTGSLDKHNAEIILNLIDDLNKQGKTIILVTHDENIKNSGRRVVSI